MSEGPFAVMAGLLRQASSRRLILQRLRGVGLGGVLALLGARTAAAPQPDAGALRAQPQSETENPTAAFFIPGPSWSLELSARGAGSDIRCWDGNRVGDVGGPLFLNNVLSGTADTIINLQQGNVGIGVGAPAAKLHVAGDLRVDGSLIGPLSFLSPYPGRDDLEIAYASLTGGETSVYARGSVALQSGEASIRFPEHFALLAEAAGLTVQLTARDRPLHLFVTELTPERLVVREAQAQDGRFDYLVQGVRKGASSYQAVRVKHVAPTAETGTV